MFNMLRMDLYRLRRTASAYVCLAMLLSFIALAYGTVWTLSTPEGLAFADQIGMVVTSSGETLESPDQLGLDLLAGYDFLMMVRDACMDGGVYLCIFGIAVTLFVCADFKNGFMKNIMALHRERWKYIGSKLAALGILNFCWLVIQFLWCALLNLLAGTLVPFSRWQDILFYYAWAWFVTTAFAALILLVCVLTRSSAAGILATVLAGSGLILQFLAYLTNLFGFQKWLDYTLYWNLTCGPSYYTGIGDLRSLGVGIAFLAIYALAASLILKKQDI